MEQSKANHECPHCNKVFSALSSLKRHINTVCSDKVVESPNRFICPDCCFGTSSEYYFSRHIKFCKRNLILTSVNERRGLNQG